MSNITEKERQEIEKFASENAVYAKDDFDCYGLYGDALFEFETDSIAKGAEFLAELRNDEKPSEDLVQQIEAIMGDFYNYANNERKYYYDIRSEHAVKIAKLFNPNAELLEALKCVQVLKDLLEYPSEVAFDHIDEAKAVHSMFQKVDSAIQKYEKP